MEKMYDRRKPDNNWHLRKEIHIGHLLATVSFMFAAVSLYINLDKRIEKNTLVNQYQDQAFQEHLKSVDKTFSGLGDDVRQIRDLLIDEYKNRK